MKFRRTDAGLSNLCRFYNVDAVVYVEGGDGLSVAEVKSGRGSDHSSDIRFWSVIFRQFGPLRRWKFKAVGSKSVLVEIAMLIRRRSVKNVIVAMDNDHDSIYRRKVACQNVLYTRGYSWENDVYQCETISGCLIGVVGSGDSAKYSTEQVVREFIRHFEQGIKGVVRIDVILGKVGYSCVDRKSIPRYVEINSARRPRINREQVRASLGQARKNFGHPIYADRRLMYRGWRNCVGHLVAEFGFRVLIYLCCSKFGMPKMAKSVVDSLLVKEFEAWLGSGKGGEIRRYYKRTMQKVSV